MFYYFILLLDGINNALAVICCLSSSFLLISLLDNSLENHFKDEKTFKKYFRLSFYLTIGMPILMWLIPDTNQAAMLVLLTADTTQQLPEIIDLLKEYIQSEIDRN